MRGHIGQTTAVPPRPARLYEAPPPDRPAVRLWGDPRDVPPPQSVHIRGQQRTTLAGPTTATLAERRFPRASLGVIREYSLDIRDLLTTSNITFALRINGAPAPGWVYEQFPFASPHVGTVLLAKQDRDYIEVPSNAVVGVFVNVADVGSYLIGATWAGWSYPKDLAGRQAAL